MCRFVAYLGHPILADELLYKPSNSLIKQSIHALETEEPLNGDGFGLGWYAHDISSEPAVVVSTKPAWNANNLKQIAPKIRSNCFFGHVRAASSGGVSDFNCHPFYYQRFLFMHNGSIFGFQRIKRHLRRQLSDEIYEWVKGQTDSEHFFGLFLNIFQNNNCKYNIADISATLKETVLQIAKLKQAHQVTDPSVLNIAITDGHNTIVLRHVSDRNIQGRSLYYATGSEFKYADGRCHILKNGNSHVGATLIVSEKLTSYEADWVNVPMDHILTVDKSLDTQLLALDAI